MNDDVSGSNPSSRKMPPGTDDETARVLEGFDLRDAMIAGLAAAANDLSKAAINLVGAARLTRLEKTVAIVLLLVNTAGMVGIIILGFLLLGLASDNRDNGDATRAGTARIVDCTTPGGDCYEAGQAGQAKAISTLVQAQIAVSVCARDPLNFDEAAVQKCVSDRLARLPK